MNIKQFCKVCGNRFEVDKDSVYLVTERLGLSGALSQAPKLYEAIDCPRCGCQKLLNIRMARLNGEQE